MANVTLTCSGNENKTIDFGNFGNISGLSAYHLLEGNLALVTSVSMAGFSTTLYTGNGSTQSITTGVDMATQWGDDSSETYGGLVWYKSRTQGVTGYAGHNNFIDTIRGNTALIWSNLTNASGTYTNYITAFNNNGFSVGNDLSTNKLSDLYASWNFQTTHRITGTTNHGKSYTCHYNPYTGFTIVQYTGSGIAGHEIPHMLGRKLGLFHIKALSATSNWWSDISGITGTNGDAMYLNLTNAKVSDYTVTNGNTDTSVVVGTSAMSNTASNTYTLLGWANSYFDSANTLIGNYEVGVYQGTGATGNKVTTRGKPAWVMVKRLDSTGDWRIHDITRGVDNILRPNLSNAEYNSDYLDFLSDGFVSTTLQNDTNASGGQYLYMCIYDNDSGSGKSKYPKALDNPTLTLNAKVPFAKGVDSNGTLVSILNKNETVTGVTLTQGKNYVYSDSTGAYGVSKFSPQYSLGYSRVSSNDNPDIFDTNTNKWYSSSGGSNLVSNGAFNDTSVWTSVGFSLSNGMALLTTTGGVAGYIQQTITTVVGITYKVKAFINANSNTNGYCVVGGATLTQPQYTSGYITGTFVAQSTSTTINFQVGSTTNGQTIYVDSVEVFEAYPTVTPITNSRNYLDAIVYADQNGQVEYVEQIPKTVYYDRVKANQYQGKNACTAWVNFDGTTTPPTIRDSFNVSSVVRTATGVFDVYFATPMDNVNYAESGSCTEGYFYSSDTKTINKFRVISRAYGGTLANVDVRVQIFGGRN